MINMKIEKVNNNQIRCTLTREDLADRQLKLSELAYGTENAKALFREIMQQAAYELGFDTEDIPLMIEAVPISSDSIILIITKVEYPDELDTRFSKFSDPDSDNGYDSSLNDTNHHAKGADDILDMVKKMQKNSKPNNDDSNVAPSSKDFVPLNQTIDTSTQETSSEQAPAEVLVNLSKLFVFHHLTEVERLSKVLKNFYHANNTLYKQSGTNQLFLIIKKGSHTPEEFNKVCNILSEYGQPEKYLQSQEAYFEEHLQIIIKDSALQQLAEI